MATFAITTTQNIDELTGKTGGDIYNINGGTLNIDQHSRFGLNNNNSGATTATSMGTVTLSATLGGTVNFDGRYVRMIPYDTGSGSWEESINWTKALSDSVGVTDVFDRQIDFKLGISDSINITEGSNQGFELEEGIAWQKNLADSISMVESVTKQHTKKGLNW